MRNKKTLSIIKFTAMLLLMIPFIVVAITKRNSFHSPWLFLGLLFLMYLDTIIVVWLLFEIKRTFTLKKSALGLSMFLLGGWIIALVTIFATKSESLIPAEHVFGGVYASLTATAIILGIFAWISNYVYKQKNHDIENKDSLIDDINDKSASEVELTKKVEIENVTADNESEVVALNAKERRKLRRQQKLHNAFVTDSETNVDIAENKKEQNNEIKAEECKEISDNDQDYSTISIETDESVAIAIESESKIADEDSLLITPTNSLIELPTVTIDDKSDDEPICEPQEFTNDSTDLNNKANNELDESTENKIETDVSQDIIEVAADAIAVGDTFSNTDVVFSDQFVENDDILSDEFNRVIAAFDEESDNAPSDGYKPVKINVFENDTIIPSEIEVVKNEFVASGKFVDYSVKDETRGMYEEIENENERKIALMTDLSKVIITSNVNATIVPIEYEILERTFENKLRQSDDDAKEYYGVIKNKILSFDGVKSRVSKLADTFKCNGEVVCKMTVSGKTLLVNLCLDCSKYDAKYFKFVDVGDMSKFADTPMRIKIKNKLTLKRCLEIIDLMFAEKNVLSSPIENVDYASQYPKVENAVIFMNSIAHLIRRE